MQLTLQTCSIFPKAVDQNSNTPQNSLFFAQTFTIMSLCISFDSWLWVTDFQKKCFHEQGYDIFVPLPK